MFINPKRLWVGAFVPNWLLECKELSANAKLIYARLCQYADSNGVAFPKQTTLAIALAMNVRTIQRGLSELVKHDLLEAKQKGLNRPNEYRFKMHDWMSQPDTTDVSHPDTTDVSDIKDVDITPTKEVAYALPPDWKPDQELTDFLARECTRVPMSEVENFRDYWTGRSDAKARRTSDAWRRTFRIWMRKEDDRRPSGRRRSVPATQDERRTSIANAVSRSRSGETVLSNL